MDAVVVSGHMIDTPDRPVPRFPPEQVRRVAGELRDALERWNVGPGTTLVTGGARGADILAAEAALERGADVRLVLASDPDDFAAGSVALPDTDLEQRFRALLDRVPYEVVSGSGDDIYERTNDRIIEVARSLDPQPRAVIVWNGETGDGRGGTSDFVERLGRVSGDENVVVIDPGP